MNTNLQEIPSLHEVLGPALHLAFLKAAELAKQTRTYLVVQRDQEIVRIPYDQIDAFIAEQAKKRES